MIDLSIFKQIYLNGAEINSLLLNGIQVWKKASGDIPDDEIWYTSPTGEVINPYKTGDYEVVSNTYNDGKGVLKLNKVITDIPDYFFYNRHLSGIVLPKKVQTIGQYAFYTSEFESFNVPEGVISIKDRAFQDCANLQEITFPSSLQKLGYGILSWTQVKKITFLGQNPPEVDYYTFGGLSKYGQVSYPDGADYTSVLFSDKDTNIGSNFTLAQGLFWGLQRITIDIKDAVEIVSNIVTKKNPIIEYKLHLKYVFTLDNGQVHIINQIGQWVIERDVSEYYGQDTYPLQIGNWYEYDKNVSSEVFTKMYTYDIPLIWEEDPETQLDWGTDDKTNQITPDPLTRDYAVELVDNMSVGTYNNLKFTNSNYEGQLGNYKQGIDGLIKCINYGTTSSIYASATSKIGDISLLNTWKSQGANVVMCYIDKPIARWGSDFIFAGPKDVNVLGFCVISGHVADDARYNRAIICMEKGTTKTADGRPTLTVSNANFYDGSTYGYIVAVIYK